MASTFQSNILLVLTTYSSFRLDTNVKTTWHVNPVEEAEELNSREGHNLMAIASKRVWDELYICKKPAIEEVSVFLIMKESISV